MKPINLILNILKKNCSDNFYPSKISFQFVNQRANVKNYKKGNEEISDNIPKL